MKKTIFVSIILFSLALLGCESKNPETVTAHSGQLTAVESVANFESEKGHVEILSPLEHNQDRDSFEIEVSVSPDVHFMVVTFENKDSNLKMVENSSIPKGDSVWRYGVDVRKANLAEGLNVYRFEGRDSLKALVAKEVRFFKPFKSGSAPVAGSKKAEIEIAYLDTPKKLDAAKFLEDWGGLMVPKKDLMSDREAFEKAIANFEVNTYDRTEKFQLAQLGTVKDGIYSGRPMILFNFEDIQDGSIVRLEFLGVQRADNSLVLLQGISWPFEMKEMSQFELQLLAQDSPGTVAWQKDGFVPKGDFRQQQYNVQYIKKTYELKDWAYKTVNEFIKKYVKNPRLEWDSTTVVKSIVLPDIVSIPDSKARLVKVSYNGDVREMDGMNFLEMDSQKKLLKWVGKNPGIYDIGGCIVSPNGNGNYSFYVIEFGFIKDQVYNMERNGVAIQSYANIGGEIEVSWDDESRTNEKYQPTAYSNFYGNSHCYSVVKDRDGELSYDGIRLGKMVPVGKTSTGATVYVEEYTKDEISKLDPNISFDKAARQIERVYGEAFGKSGFEDFIKTHPVMYLMDPFGRFLQFQNESYMQIG